MGPLVIPSSASTSGGGAFTPLPSPMDLQTSRDRLLKRGPMQGFDASPFDLQYLAELESQANQAQQQPQEQPQPTRRRRQQPQEGQDRYGADMKAKNWQPFEPSRYQQAQAISQAGLGRR